jgi:hypothetical protein
VVVKVVEGVVGGDQKLSSHFLLFLALPLLRAKKRKTLCSSSRG